MTTPSLLLHVPHSSTLVPEGVRDQFVLSDVELERELLLMTDHYVDELFTLPAAEATAVRHGVSRLVCDPERFERDEDEEMAGIFDGAIVPMRFYRRDARLCSIMIEVRRDQYMDEQTGKRLPGFSEVAARIQTAVRVLSHSPTPTRPRGRARPSAPASAPPSQDGT